MSKKRKKLYSLFFLCAVIGATVCGELYGYAPLPKNAAAASDTTLAVSGENDGFRLKELHFLQYALQEQEAVTRSWSALERILANISATMFSSSSLLSERRNAKPEPMPALERLADLAEFVFERTPELIIVWPSESYYYFTADTSDGEYAGNFRFTEIGEGAATFAIFPVGRNNQRDVGRVLPLVEETGFTAHRVWGSLFEVKYRAHTRLVWVEEGSAHLRQPAILGLDEQWLSWLRDESGTPFHLVYDLNDNGFFFVLDESGGVESDLVSYGDGANGDFIVSSRTEFVFLQEHDPLRKILVGVRSSNIESNSYFDGPFDQIPGHLPLRELIYQSYPYLKLGGVDEFGFYCMADGMRAAITPYFQYSTKEEFLENASRCADMSSSHSERRSCLTFDEKRNFHLQSKAFNEDGTLVSGKEPIICSRATATRLHEAARKLK